MSLPFSTQIESVCPGSLLLASTQLRGDVFQRTVVYILEHDERGTFGLVVNRPTKIPVSSVAAEWAELVAEPSLLYNGGPVRKDGLLCLGRPRVGSVAQEGEEDAEQDRGYSLLAPGVAVVNLEADTRLTGTSLQHVRIFSGYSGWSGGQLAHELEQGSWYVAQGMPQDVFTGPNIDLWGLVLRRQGARASVLATHPIDVGVN